MYFIRHKNVDDIYKLLSRNKILPLWRNDACCTGEKNENNDYDRP